VTGASTSQTATIAKTNGTVNITSPNPSPASINGTYNVTTTTNAGAVTLSIDPSTAGNCGLSGSTVTFQHAGSCVIDASAAATSDVTGVTTFQSVTVAKTPGTISITSTNPSPASIGSTYGVTTTTNAGAVALSIDPSTSANCSIATATVTFLHAGSCEIDADAAFTSDVTSASTNQTVTIAKTPQVITFAGPGLGTFGGTATLSAIGGGSGSPVVFTIDGTSGAVVCGVSGTNGTALSYTATGTCVIDANQGGNADYGAATLVQRSVTVSKAPQAITITSHPPANPMFGGTYTMAASGGASANPVVFTSATPPTCTVSGATVSFVGLGTCTVDANQAFSANYLAAPQVQQSFVVSKASTSLTAASVSIVSSILMLGVTFSATLTSQATGKGIAGQTVTFADGSLASCSATTNANGVASCTASVLAVLGLLLSPSYSAAYAGGTDYLGANGAGGVTL
jgi:hypothetical protein